MPVPSRGRTMNISNETKAALSRILSYMEVEEERDYFLTSPEERSGHIYESILIIRRWMNSPSAEPDYFGGCPTCGDGQNDGLYNVNRFHWLVCHIHRLRWCIGENLFSCWKSETPADWRENWKLVGGYQEIPYPTPVG